MEETKERGAVAVIVALLMVALLGFGAIAIDGAMLYAQKAQMQNAADAAALAIAQDCAKRGTTACVPAAPAKALQLAAANANSGITSAPALSFPSSGTVSVTTAAKDADGEGVSLFLANVFGISRAAVGATSTATWGSPSGGTAALPVAFSECQFDLSGAVQLLPLHGTKTCVSSSPSGQILPGGFGWLTPDDAAVCGATVTVEKPAVSSKNGESMPNQQQCKVHLLARPDCSAAGVRQYRCRRQLPHQGVRGVPDPRVQLPGTVLEQQWNARLQGIMHRNHREVRRIRHACQPSLRGRQPRGKDGEAQPVKGPSADAFEQRRVNRS